jgi:hypothetical protein
MATNPPHILYERRRNPSRRRAPVDVEYWVLWNDNHRAFRVYRGDVRKELSARDFATAIDLAIREAQQEPPELKVAVKSLRAGKAAVEWSR